MLKAHSKTPIESLYLETGVVPIKYVIMSRRLSYLKNILSKNDHELIKKVYLAQKRKPVKNDWVKSVEDDLKQLKINLTDNQISAMSKKLFKKIIKAKIRKLALEELNHKKEKHSKVKNIIYNKSICSVQTLSSIFCTFIIYPSLRKIFRESLKLFFFVWIPAGSSYKLPCKIWSV